MGWLEFGLVGSIIFALHYFQQIKLTLKAKGHDVGLLTGWLADYRRFRQLIQDEPDRKKKVEYQGILNGLHLALAGLVVIAVILFKKQ